ncbi:MAG: SH3 domain-containing protein, partial [Bdellovibrionales bacterium]|nr:SH3 domain-containing protein [Bdellovibrionales bacterium]
MRLLLVLLFLTGFCFSAEADQDAIVVAEPSFVYKKPDFDAKQIGELHINQKIRVSQKKFGAFYRTKTPQNVIGYVSDADVRVSGGSKPSKDDGPLKDDPEEQPQPKAVSGPHPWWNRWMVGGVLGYARYAELFNREEKASLGLVYGGKITIPLRFLGEYSLDVSVQGSFTAPQFYRDVAVTTPSGSFWYIELPVLMKLSHFWG